MKSAVIASLIFLLTGISFLFVVSSIGLIFFPDFAVRIDRFLPKFPVSITQTISESIDPTPTPLTKDIILAGINRVRLLSKIQELSNESSLCTLAQMTANGEKLTSPQIILRCPTCAEIVSITFDRRVSLGLALQYLEDDATASAMIKNKNLNAACLAENDTAITFIAAQKRTVSKPLPQRIITGDELFQSLSDYRKVQGKKELNRDDKLCLYANKRVADHLGLLSEDKPKESYPVPEKYPLDAHDGFKKDAESGLVFDMTGRKSIAENLAYWPTAQYGVHVIEWGWDTSTEGHRETQLSDDYDAVCLSGKEGFFVAIFGK